MLDIDGDHHVESALTALLNGGPDQADDLFHNLVSSVWKDGEHTATAAAATPVLVSSLTALPPDHQGRVIFLLGLLTESSGPERDAVRESVRRGLPAYLDLLDRAEPTAALTSALLYLLAQLPAERARILPVARRRSLPGPDLTRLERCLADFDPADPRISRCWPSPAAWAAMTDEQRETDRQWMSLLPPEKVRAAWDSDTSSLLAYAGAKALWAVRHGPVDDYHDPDLSLPAREPVPDGDDVFRGHGEIFRCPRCRGPVSRHGSAIRCPACPAAFPLTDNAPDFSEGIGDSTDLMARNVPVGYSALRGSFRRLMGTGWDGRTTVQVEDEYLRNWVTPAAGPALDLGAGTGRWTAILADLLGEDRVLALDVSRGSLAHLRTSLPRVLAVRGNALSMPFGDATLGAVNCWNTLQALPDRPRVIAEVGRCLRPGGTFTVLTYRPTDDSLYRYFQSKKFGVVGVNLTSREEMRGWIEAAGMTVRDEYLPNTFMFVTAVR
jgi:phospholipid N-methyltransferase